MQSDVTANEIKVSVCWWSVGRWSVCGVAAAAAGLGGVAVAVALAALGPLGVASTDWTTRDKQRHSILQ